MSAPDTFAATPQNPPKKKVTGCSPRLAGLERAAPAPLKPLTEAHYLTPEQLRKHVESVYNNAVQHATQRNKTLEEKYVQPLLTPKDPISEEEATQQAFRLAVQDPQQRRQRHEAVVSKLASVRSPSSSRKEKHEKKDSGEKKEKEPAEAKKQVPTVVSRLYDDSLVHQKDVTERLANKYSPKRVYPVRPDNLWSQTIERLASPSKRQI